MSVPFIIFLTVIILICAVIFAKTVSNDAENDYKLRDILANAGGDEDDVEEKEDIILPGQEIEKPKFFDEPKPKFEHADKQPVLPKYFEKNTEVETKQNDYAYSTTTHETARGTEEAEDDVSVETAVRTEEKVVSEPVEDVLPETVPEKSDAVKTYSNSVQYDEPVYYEKINDDACEPDEYQSEETEDTVDGHEEDAQIYAEKFEQDEFVEDEAFEKSQLKTIKIFSAKSMYDFIKTFWKGITFTFGALLCLYAFYGIVTQAQSPNDALLYSIWLLIGVILIK